MSTSTPLDLTGLLATAKDDEFLSLSTLDTINSVGLSTIQNNFGITVDNFGGSNECLLIGVIIDDSSSIREIPNGEQLICDGQQMFIDELMKHQARRDILVCQQLLNHTRPLHPFVELSDIIPLENGRNYEANGNTKLYEKSCEMLSTMILKAKVEFMQAGFLTRIIFVVITDGEDCGSKREFTADKVKELVTEIGNESLLFYFIGIEGNQRVDFRRIADEMGALHILTPSSNPQEIAAAFRSVSKSVSSAAMSGASFTKAASNPLLD